MRTPKGIDAVNVMNAVHGLTTRTPLRTMGLNRREYRNAKKAQAWFLSEIIKAMRVRIRNLKK